MKGDAMTNENESLGKIIWQQVDPSVPIPEVGEEIRLTFAEQWELTKALTKAFEAHIQSFLKIPGILPTGGGNPPVYPPPNNPGQPQPTNPGYPISTHPLPGTHPRWPI